MATRDKPATVPEIVYLTFPRDLIKEPVCSVLSKQFDVIFNIRGSMVTAEMGWVALEIEGKDSEVGKAIAWLKSKGVAVEPIEKNVIESTRYCAAAEIDSTRAPPSCDGPPRIKFPLFGIFTVVSSSGFWPCVKRTLSEIRLS